MTTRGPAIIVNVERVLVVAKLRSRAAWHRRKHREFSAPGADPAARDHHHLASAELEAIAAEIEGRR